MTKIAKILTISIFPISVTTRPRYVEIDFLLETRIPMNMVAKPYLLYSKVVIICYILLGIPTLFAVP